MHRAVPHVPNRKGKRTLDCTKSGLEEVEWRLVFPWGGMWMGGWMVLIVNEVRL